MKHHIDIINGMDKIFIEMGKGDVSDLEITNKIVKYKNLLKEMDEVYRCVRRLTISNGKKIILQIQYFCGEN